MEELYLVNLEVLSIRGWGSREDGFNQISSVEFNLPMFYLELSLVSHLAKIVKEHYRFVLFIDRFNHSNSVPFYLLFKFFKWYTIQIFVSFLRFPDTTGITLEPPKQILGCLPFKSNALYLICNQIRWQ